MSNGANSLLIGDAESDSPCIGVCSTLFDEVCIGCGRTAQEVCNWVFLSPAEKNSLGTHSIRRYGNALPD